MSAIIDTTTMRRFSPPTTPGQHAATAREREEENDEKNLRGLSEFERMRERRIAKNMQRMREMGLEKIAAPPWQSPIVVDGQTPRKVRLIFFFARVVVDDHRRRRRRRSSLPSSSSLCIPNRPNNNARFCGRKSPTETTSQIDKILFSLNRKGKLL